MKKHTDVIQTMRLKDLGFPPPKGVSKLSLDWDMDTVPTFDYSIGELIEMLPKQIETDDDFVATFQMTAGWEIYYTTYSDIFYYFNNVELVDALFDMTIKLKEEGKI